MTGLHPHRVIARFDRIPADIPLETNAQMMVEFEGGIPGMIRTSQVAMGHETELNVRILGEKGSIEWSHLKPWELRVTRINQPPQLYTTNRDYLYPAAKELCRLPSGHIEGFYEAFGNLYRGFCMNLIARKTGGDPGSFRYPTVEDGVRGDCVCGRLPGIQCPEQRLGNGWRNVNRKGKRPSVGRPFAVLFCFCRDKPAPFFKP